MAPLMQAAWTAIRTARAVLFGKPKIFKFRQISTVFWLGLPAGRIRSKQMKEIVITIAAMAAVAVSSSLMAYPVPSTLRVDFPIPACPPDCAPSAPSQVPEHSMNAAVPPEHFFGSPLWPMRWSGFGAFVRHCLDAIHHSRHSPARKSLNRHDRRTYWLRSNGDQHEKRAFFPASLLLSRAGYVRYPDNRHVARRLVQH